MSYLLSQSHSPVPAILLKKRPLYDLNLPPESAEPPQQVKIPFMQSTANKSLAPAGAALSTQPKEPTPPGNASGLQQSQPAGARGRGWFSHYLAGVLPQAQATSTPGGSGLPSSAPRPRAQSFSALASAALRSGVAMRPADQAAAQTKDEARTTPPVSQNLQEGKLTNPPAAAQPATETPPTTPSAPAPPAPVTPPNHGDAGNARILADADKRGVVIQNDKIAQHTDPKGGERFHTGFVQPDFSDDAKQGASFPYRDDHGVQHLIGVKDMRRFTGSDGNVNYQFMVNGSTVSEPEGARPLFQTDPDGNRFTHAADGTRHGLDRDINASAQAADKAREEKLTQGVEMSHQLEQKQAQAAAAQQRLDTAKMRANEIRKARSSYGNEAQEQPTAEEESAARQELMDAHFANESQAQELQALQKQHDEHYRSLASEHGARQEETGGYKNAAVESPADAQWQKDARSAQGDPLTSKLSLVAEAEKKAPAAATTARKAMTAQPTQRLFDAAGKAFGGKGGQPPAAGKSLSLHEVLMQAPEMKQGGWKTVDQSDAARSTAQNALGISDPENVRVTRSADGSYSLARKAADGSRAELPFATLDPRASRITLTPGADGRLSQAAVDMAAASSRDSTPIFLPGGQPPMSEAERSALIAKGEQAASASSDRRQADAALTHAGLSPEGIMRLRQQGRISVQDAQFLNDKFNGGVSSYAERMAAEAAQQREAGMQKMYQGGQGPKDKPDFQSWMQKGSPKRDAQVQAKAKELGVSEDEVRRDLEMRRLMDFSTASTQQIHDKQNSWTYRAAHALDMADIAEPSRVLPDGSIVVNPELSVDQAQFDQAVELSSASREAKEAAHKQWAAYHDAWLTKATETLKSSQTLPFVQDYNEWLTKNQLKGHFSEKRPDGSVRPYTDNEKTQLYIDAMKNRNGFVKFMDNVSTALVAGGGHVVAGVLGAEALARNSFQDLTGLNIGGQAFSEASAEMARQSQALTQSHELTGTADGAVSRTVGGLVQAVPSIGIGVATGGATALALGAAQSMGSTYTDLYQHHLAQGLTPEAAHRAAAGTAIASGAVSLFLSKIMSGGSGALNNPAARDAARKSFDATVKTFLKGAGSEVTQETLDGGFNHIASEINKGRSFQEAAASYVDQYPQSLLTSALLGGTLESQPHRQDASPGSSQVPVPTFEQAAAAHQTVEKLKGQKEPLSPAQQKERAAAEQILAQKTAANILKQKATLEARGDTLHPITAQALADAQARLAPQAAAAATPPPNSNQPTGPTATAAGTPPTTGSTSGEAPPAAEGTIAPAPTAPGQRPGAAEANRQPSSADSSAQAHLPETTTQTRAAGKAGETVLLPAATDRSRQPRPNSPAPQAQAAQARPQNADGSDLSPPSPFHPPADEPPLPLANHAKPAQSFSTPVPTFEQATAAHQTVEKFKAQKEPLSPAQQQARAAAEQILARKTEANILDQKADIEARSGALHPDAAKALVEAQAVLGRAGGKDVRGSSSSSANTTFYHSDANAGQVKAPHAVAGGYAAEGMMKGGQQVGPPSTGRASQTNAYVQPSTPPLSAAQSQRLIEDVSQMPPEAQQQHPQVQADLAQARSVVNQALTGPSSQNTPDHALHSEQGPESIHGTPEQNSGSWQKGNGKADTNAKPLTKEQWAARPEFKPDPNPVQAADLMTWSPEHPVSPEMKSNIMAGAQGLLDLLPREIAQSLGKVRLAVVTSLGKNVVGKYDPSSNSLILSADQIRNFTPEQLRKTMWHETGHWLYHRAGDASAHASMKKWRSAIEEHWRERTKNEPFLYNSEGKWHYMLDGWISDYAGRFYGSQGGLELPSVYLEEASWGAGRLAFLGKMHESFHADETFNIILSIFKK